MLTFLKRLVGSVPTPSAGKVTVFIDSATGLPRYKDETGADFSLGTAFTGGNLATAINWKQFTAIASAATTDIGGAAGNYGHITGTTTITSLGTAPQAGSPRIVVFDGSLTLTHNATSLILPAGANIQTAAGDVACFVTDGSTTNWRCLWYRRANGQPLAASVNALTNSSGTVTVNCALGINFTITLAANVGTLSLTNLNGAGFATEIEIEIKQDATGGRTFALPASFKALGGSDTSINAAANGVTLLSAKTFDNGTTWRYAMQESA